MQFYFNLAFAQPGKTTPVGVLYAAERYIVRLLKDEAEMSRRRHDSVVGDALVNDNGSEQQS